MIDPAFETFWKTYPRKVGKPKALEAWKKIEDQDKLPKILKALEWQKCMEQWEEDEGRFIPHPSTYLNQKRYLDEPVEPLAKPQLGMFPED